MISVFSYRVVIAEDVVPTDPVSAAYSYMTMAMDEDINSFYVYADADSGGNHFYPSGFYNGSGTNEVSTRWTDNPHSGSSCIRVQWTGGPGSDGLLWNGVLFEAPEGFLNTLNGAGYDLTGAKTLSFWARSDEPGLKVEFGFGCIGDPSGEHKKWYGLTNSWQKIEIDLTGINLTNVHGGFLFSLNNPNDPDPAGATFYLDDIKYNLSKPDQLRLIRSFTTVTDTEDFDIRSKNLAALYDNALAILAYLDRGKEDDIRRALILADTMVFAHEYDTNVVPVDWAYAPPPFSGHRLRDGYSSGAITDSQGHFRYAGWWEDPAKKWYMHESALSFRTGDLAWAMIALANVYHITKNDKYLNAAVEMGTWIVQNCERNGTGMDSGYSGGWVWNWETEEWDSIGTSTEHNIDLAAAFGLLHKITKQAAWESRSNHAKEFVQSIWDTEGYFKTGLDSKGGLSEIKVLDVQAWGAMLLQSDPYWSALNWAITYLAYKDPTIPPAWLQFDFNNDIDGIWYEGIAQMASAFRQAGRNAEFINTILPLCDIQLNGPHADGKGIQASSIKGLTTGFGWKYYDRLGLGPTCWFAFAENGYNPFGTELLVRPNDKRKDELVLNFGPVYGLYQYDQAGGWKQWNTVNTSQMVTVDLNDDGQDELVAAFPGYGLYTYVSPNAWQLINTVIPQTMIRLTSGIVCDFGTTHGLWYWRQTGGWQQWSAMDPYTLLAVDVDKDGTDELVASFPGYGLYIHDSTSGWQLINTTIPESFIRLNNGIACDYGTMYGLWHWTQAGGWVQWNTADPDTLLAVDVDNDGTDELVASFGGYGLYWRNGAGAWPQINTVIPENMIRQSNGIAVDFGSAYGLWVWSQADGWQQRNAVDPGQMAAVDIDKDGVEELVVSFPGYGLWHYDEAIGWQFLNDVVPDDMKPINFYRYPNYVSCTTDDQCGKDQTCDKTECLSCCPNSAVPCIDLCCGKCDAKPSCKDQTYSRACKEDADCTCGINVITKECDYGIAECINDFQQWPDFCTGIAGNLEIVCKDNQCVQVVKPTGCTTDADCTYGAEWCERGICVPCDKRGQTCTILCVLVEPRNGCQPCECQTSYTPCTSSDQCSLGQICDKSECVSCCPGSTGACVSACCGKCVSELGGFCGWSSNGPCAADADCVTGGCSGQVCQSISEEPVITTCEWSECYSAKAYGVSCGCVNATCQWK
jgi:eight-cysteine-cluster-containing protein